MSTALAISDRAAEIVAWCEAYNAPPTLAPPCIGKADIHRRVEVHALDHGAFEAIRTVGREHWSYGSRNGAQWLTYEPNDGIRVVLFRA